MAVRLPHVPPPSPRLDAEGELAAALQELEGLGRLGRSASVMAMLPMPLLPGDYAAREAARHSRSLAEHLLEADPMARQPTAARHPPANAPPQLTASPTPATPTRLPC